jgi:hypothetical protein
VHCRACGALWSLRGDDSPFNRWVSIRPTSTMGYPVITLGNFKVYFFYPVISAVSSASGVLHVDGTWFRGVYKESVPLPVL